MAHTLQQIQMLVDQIRAAVLSEQFEETSEMRQLARELAEVTRQLNHRLRQCSEYLRQGLRGEAIREADAEPQLLEAVSVVEGLSEEEWQSWNDVCEFLELPRPEATLEEAALLLDSAYEEYGPLETLMRTHRRLALQRAPLSMRLPVLRKLQQEDPGTEFWETDIVEYEKARQAEIGKQLRKLAKAPSQEELSELAAELDDPAWRTPVPKRIRAAVKDLLQQTERDEARKRLREAAETLHEAFSEMNFAKARPAYELWQQNRPLAELPEGDPLAIDMIPALSWCEQSASQEAEESAWAAAVSRTEALLEKRDVSLLDLERAADELDRFERPLPKSLGNRLQLRIDGLHLRKKRQRLLIIGSSTLATIAVVGLVTVVVVQANENRFRNDVLGRVQGFVEAGDVQQASGLLTQFEGRWSGSADWLDAVKSVNELQASIDDRTRRLESILLEAKAVPDRDDKAFNAMKAEAEQIVQEEPIVAALNERMELGFRDLASQRGIRLQQREAGLFERLNAQSQQLDELKNNVAMLEKEVFESRIQRMKDALSIIEKEGAGMNPQIQSQAQLLTSQAADLTTQVYRRIRHQKLLEELAEMSRTPLGNSGKLSQDYADLLKQLGEVLTEEAELAEVKRLTQDVPALQAVEKFCETFAQSASKLFPTAASEIAVRKAAVAEYLSAHPKSPLRKEVEEYQAVLDVLDKRHGDTTNLVERVRSAAVDDFAMKGLYMVRVKDQQWPFYVTEFRQFPEKRIVELSSYRQDRQPHLVRLNANDLLSEMAEKAPQQELAKTLSDQLGRIGYANWESQFEQMSRDVIDAENVDPILKLRLLMILQMQAQEGSLTLKNHQPFQAYVKEQTETSQRVNLLTQWPDPVDADVASRRKLAENYIDSLRLTNALEKVWASSEKSLQDLHASLNRPFQCVGWMTRNEDGEPVLDIDLPETGAWNVAVCKGEADEKSAATLQQIGSVSNGQVTIPDESWKYEFCPCRLVLAWPSQTP